VEVLDLLLAEGVDREVDVDEEGHAHNYHKVDIQNNLKTKVHIRKDKKCKTELAMRES
jgi:hypothetical protein